MGKYDELPKLLKDKKTEKQIAKYFDVSVETLQWHINKLTGTSKPKAKATKRNKNPVLTVLKKIPEFNDSRPAIKAIMENLTKEVVTQVKKFEGKDKKALIGDGTVINDGCIFQDLLVVVSSAAIMLDLKQDSIDLKDLEIYGLKKTKTLKPKSFKGRILNTILRASKKQKASAAAK